MAYQLKELKIYPGGLNLLPPSDQVNEGDCIDLTDWWPGSAGKLEQAPQLNIISDGTEKGVDSLLEADGRIYYGGAGTLSQIGRGTIDTGYDGYPLGLISFQGFAWIMNPGKQRRDDGTTTSDWWVGNPYPSVAVTDLPGQGALANNPAYLNANGQQEYEYYLTWVIAGLGETNPARTAGTIPGEPEGGTPITVSPGDAVQLNAPIANAPAGATGWNIYRQNYIDSSGIGVFGLPYLLNPTPIPMSQSVYVDTGSAALQQDDLSLQTLGVIMATDHDGPPPARIIGNQTFNGRIVVGNSAEHPNRIWWTDGDEPGFFPGSQNPNSGNWVDIGTDSGDEILFIAVRPLTLIIYRRKSIWRVLGDFDDPNSRIDPIVPELGVAGPRAVVSTSLGDYFVASAGRGVYSFNNDWAQKISQKQDPIFRGLPTENFPLYGKGYEQQCAVGFRDGRVWVSYPLSDGFPVVSLIYHLDSQRWFSNSRGYGAFLDIGSQFLGLNGDVCALESRYVGANTILGFQSQYHDVGLPDREKTWADLVINHNTQGEDIEITVRTNKNANPTTDSFTLAFIVSNVMTKQIIPLVYPSNYPVTALQGQPIVAYSLSLKLSGFGADDAPVEIDGPLVLHYHVEARNARTFDTAPTDHGTPYVKIVDQVQFDVDASNVSIAADSAALLQFYSDIPGGAMALRPASNCQVGPTVGRAQEVIVPAQPVAGHLLRYTVTEPKRIKIYGMRARVLPIGVYLDGSINEFWEPLPISIGV